MNLELQQLKDDYTTLIVKAKADADSEHELLTPNKEYEILDVEEDIMNDDYFLVIRADNGKVESIEVMYFDLID